MGGYDFKGIPGRYTWIPCRMIHHQERMSHYFGICKPDYCLNRVFSCTTECFGRLFHYNHRPFDNFDFHHMYCTYKWKIHFIQYLTRLTWTHANQLCMSMFHHRCSRMIHYHHYHNHMVYTIQQLN